MLSRTWEFNVNSIFIMSYEDSAKSCSVFRTSYSWSFTLSYFHFDLCIKSTALDSWVMFYIFICSVIGCCCLHGVRSSVIFGFTACKKNKTGLYFIVSLTTSGLQIGKFSECSAMCRNPALPHSQKYFVG